MDNQFLVSKKIEFSHNNLDLIRLFAATQVVLMHTMAHLHLQDLFFLNWLGLFPGVPIFFFISGFLIYRSYTKSSSLTTYFLNRILRIYPALWFCLLLSVGFLLIYEYLDIRILVSREFWVWIVSQMTFVQFYNPDFMRNFGVGVLNGSLWTISVELQFYILTPIVFFLTTKWRNSWFFLLVVFLLLNSLRNIMPIYGSFGKIYSVTFIPWFGMFLLGAWLSTREDVVKNIANFSFINIFILGVLVNIFCYFLGFSVAGNTINLLSFLIISLAVIKIAYSYPETSYKLLKGNDISYGVYIYHMPIINFIIFFGVQKSNYLILVVVCVTYLFASLSWFFLEKPILALKRNSIRSS